MTLLTPPSFNQGGTYTALLDRIYGNTVTTMRNFGANHQARRGFFPARSPAFNVVSGMDVAVGPCAGIITNTFSTDGGEYKFANPSNFQVTLAGSSPTLNRYDIIGIQVKDHFYDSSGLNDVVPSVVQGTNSAGTPSDPTYPNAFIPVCRAVINAGVTTPSLQSLVTRTTHDGGLLPISSDTERANIGTPYAGMPIIRTDQFGTIQMWSGSAWLSSITNPAYIHLRQTAAQALANATWVSITWPTEDLDNFAMHSGSSATVTCQRAGVYLLGGGVSTGVNTTGGRASRWMLNGAVISGSTGMTPGIAVLAGQAPARTLLVRLIVGDTIELQGWQNSGGSLNTIASGENMSSLSMLWVAP